LSEETFDLSAEEFLRSERNDFDVKGFGNKLCSLDGDVEQRRSAALMP
jgi:hypothetical protein